MAKKTIHHLDFDSLAEVNREVVLLTNEPHEFTSADGEKLKELLDEVEQRANNEGAEEAVAEKAALLIFKIASGQHFRSGNKRTALLAGLVFLEKNGRKLKIDDPEFVSIVDRVGMAAASLDDVYGAVESRVKKSPLERKSWESLIKREIEANKPFLIEAGA